MPNFSRETCRKGQRCEPLNMTQWIYCAAWHSDREFNDVASKAQIARRRLKELARGADGKRWTLGEITRLMKATDRELEGMQALIAHMSLDHRVIAVRRQEGADTDSITKEFLEATAAHGQTAHAIVVNGLRDEASCREALDRIRREQKENADVEYAIEARLRLFERRRPIAVGA
jgi:hypothetical protein